MANKLAIAFGHYWGGVQIDLEGEITPETVKEEVLRQFGSPPSSASIVCPETNVLGEVVYTTNSGRTTWIITEKGEVLVYICSRVKGAAYPETTVLSARILGQLVNVEIAKPKLLYPRHVHLLRKVLAIVLEKSRDSLRLSRLLAKAEMVAKENEKGLISVLPAIPSYEGKKVPN